MQGTRVPGLVREDPTCHRATKPVHHNYWACALEPASHNYWACVLFSLGSVLLPFLMSFSPILLSNLAWLYPAGELPEPGTADSFHLMCQVWSVGRSSLERHRTDRAEIYVLFCSSLTLAPLFHWGRGGGRDRSGSPITCSLMTPLGNLLRLNFFMTLCGCELSWVSFGIYLLPHLGPFQVTLRKNNTEFTIVTYIRKFWNNAPLFLQNSSSKC